MEAFLRFSYAKSMVISILPRRAKEHGKHQSPVKVAFVKIFCDMILPNPKMVLTLFGQSGVDNHVPWAHIERPMIATDVSMRDRLICAGYFLKFHGNPAAPHM